MNNAITVTTDESKADPYAWKCVFALDFGAMDKSNKINATSAAKTTVVVMYAVASDPQIFIIQVINLMELVIN